MRDRKPRGFSLSGIVRLVGLSGLLFPLIAGLLHAATPSALSKPSGPSEVIEALYAELLGTMQNGQHLGAHGRFERLAPVVARSFDVRFMIGSVIGLPWSNMSPDQQQSAEDAFGRYITAVYANRFDSYSGQQFRVLGQLMSNHHGVVRTEIVKSTGEVVSINYLVHDRQASWEIYDILLGGTVSELAVRRSEFSAILRSRGIDGLIGMLNEKADKLL